MGTRWGASRRFLSGRAVLHKPPPLSEWACTAPSEHPWGVDWMALQAPPVSGCAAQAYPSGLSEEAGVWVCEILGWSLCRDSREWLCTPVGIWGASALFVGPVGGGVPACALSCSPLVRVCVRERVSVGVHVMGIRGSVWAGGGRGGGKWPCCRLPPEAHTLPLAFTVLK